MKLKFTLIILFLSTNYFLAQQYQIPASVFGNGGNSISSSNFILYSTVGQTLIGKIQGSNFIDLVGFWYEPDYIVSVEKVLDMLPMEYRLEQNYPNPFNPSTTIRFAVKERSNVELVVFNLLGESIVTLVNEELDTGWYETRFNAGNLSSGVYFYTISAKSATNVFFQTKKMLLVK
jgi:hypothetical protein